MDKSQIPEGFPLSRFVLLPLDITTPHELPLPDYALTVDPTFKDTQNSSQVDVKPLLTHFTSSFLERAREVMNSYGKDAIELHDVVAVWCACMNPPGTEQGSSVYPKLQPGWISTPRNFNIER